jgi:hypothetical protein
MEFMLQLYQIWGFYGGDYEECRVLGYKNSVRASQETRYVSATESSMLMLCKICGFFTAVTMKNAVFCDVTPCGSCKNWSFGGTQRHHHEGDKNRWTRNNVFNISFKLTWSSWQYYKIAHEILFCVFLIITSANISVVIPDNHSLVKSKSRDYCFLPGIHCLECSICTPNPLGVYFV